MNHQEHLSAPVVLFYTEGAETYSVNAAGYIGRPAIGMKPSGGWRFTGLGTWQGHVRYSFPGLVRALIGGESLPSKQARHVYDLDHGTHRSHGNECKRIWLANPGDSTGHGLHADALLELIDRLDAERREAERVAANAENAARLSVAQRAPVVYSDSRYRIALHRFRGRPSGFEGRGAAFAVVDDGTATEPLDYGAAMRALGEALHEAAEAATSEERERTLEA